MEPEKRIMMFVAANPHVVKDYPDLQQCALAYAATLKKKGIDPMSLVDPEVQGFGVLCGECVACADCYACATCWVDIEA